MNKKRVLQRKADQLFYQVCLEISPVCLLCGARAVQVHHFLPKGCHGHLRYSVPNGIPICMRCHFILTHKDSSLQAEIVAKKGEEWYNNLKELDKERPTSFATIGYYEKTIETLTKTLKLLQK